MTAETDHRSMRVPRALWKERYGPLVGDRTADLKRYVSWRTENPHVHLDDEPPGVPCDFLATVRIEPKLWDPFTEQVGPRAVSADLRRYMWWRVRNPEARLPRRSAHQPAYA